MDALIPAIIVVYADSVTAFAILHRMRLEIDSLEPIANLFSAPLRFAISSHRRRPRHVRAARIRAIVCLDRAAAIQVSAENLAKLLSVSISAADVEIVCPRCLLWRRCALAPSDGPERTAACLPVLQTVAPPPDKATAIQPHRFACAPRPRSDTSPVATAPPLCRRSPSSRRYSQRTPVSVPFPTVPTVFCYCS